MADLLIYVASSYSHPDPPANCNRAIQAGDELLEAGFTPLIPHLSLAWQLVSPKDYRTWLEIDFVYLKRCDALFRLPGHSPGADEEEVLAKKHGIPVFHELAELIAWRDSR